MIAISVEDNPLGARGAPWTAPHVLAAAELRCRNRQEHEKGDAGDVDLRGENDQEQNCRREERTSPLLAQFEEQGSHMEQREGGERG
ncbi:MAG TPA: hypothetical protein VE420_12695 [Gemmatimonadales bacterium]|nr:hypothetical protein [Gemmatimonadales bacterium]